MANNYCQFSAGIHDITPKEVAWIEAEAETLTEQVDGGMGFSLSFETDHKNETKFLWLNSGDESGNPDSVISFVQSFLKEFRPNESFVITWADTCSKLRLDEFGGGAAFVTAKGAKWVNTHSWAQKQAEKFNARKAAKKGKG